MKNKWFRQMLRRRIFVILLLILQAVVLIVLVRDTSRAARWFDLALRIISFLVALRVISSPDKPSYKLLWVMLILLAPVFGGLFYLLVRFQSSTRRMTRRAEQTEKDGAAHLKGDRDACEAACEAARKAAPEYLPQITYLNRCGFPVYENTYCDYFASGESVFSALLRDLEKAEQFIFLEFFIIERGVMWNAIHEILRQKAAQGVDVRVLYDDMGSFLTLPGDYARQLGAEGIRCQVFNPFRPVLSSIQNNRDHRKIVSVDGKVAYTGGFNLADEYINAREKHGHWKDAGLRLEGGAAWSLTVFFLQMWCLACGTRSDERVLCPPPVTVQAAGLVQPYADSPMDKENVGENVYMQIIHKAKQYIYIQTPYLIVDDSMLSALTLAAKSGVDVRIITPHHWDKWIVHMTTRAFYRPLLEAGVKIYEYTPGFLHAKTFVCDDCIATVGTVNLDYRSLYLHFECGVWMYGNRAVTQVKEDVLHTLTLSQPMQTTALRGGVLTRIFQEILHVVAPLF